MCSANNLFEKIADNILTNLPKNNDLKITGATLFYEFSKLILFNNKQFTIDKKKLVTVFYHQKKDILSVQIQSASIKIVLNAKFGFLKDKKKLFRDVSKIGHWGNGDYQIKLEDHEHFDYVIKLIDQMC
jgi:predicted transport protein